MFSAAPEIFQLPASSDDVVVLKRTKELRNLISGDEMLMKFRTEDAYLLRFLHSAAFNVELALEKMRAYSEFTLENPTWFATYSPLEKKSEIETHDIAFIQERDRTGRQLVIIKLAKIDAINSSPREKAELLDLWAENVMDDPKTQATGFSVIVDIEGYSWRLFKWITPTNIRMVSKKIDLYPIKELLIHVVNTSFLLSATLKIVWPFLNEKLKRMFKFHLDDWSSLHEYISPDILPSEYAGTGPDIDFDKATQWLFDNAEEIERKLIYVRNATQQ